MRFNIKSGLAVFLSTTLLFGVFSSFVGNTWAVNADTGNVIEKPVAGFGTKLIGDPVVPAATTDLWQGSYVYFGMADTDGDGVNEPVKYRVLDSDTTVFSSDDTVHTMLLDCDTAIWIDGSPTYLFDSQTRTLWANSELKAYLNEDFLLNSFSGLEQSVITNSTKTEASATDGEGRAIFDFAPLQGEKIFVLDAKEATNTSYGYSNVGQGYCDNRIKEGDDGSWWLRSPYGSDQGAIVMSSGSMNFGYKWGEHGITPSFNISKTSVFMTSSVLMDKTNALVIDSPQLGVTTNTEWKLTLSDSGKNITVTEDCFVVRAENGTITVPYTYSDLSVSDSEKVNQISIMITDKEYTDSNAAILYYGSLQNTNFNETSGEGTFVLPNALNNKVMGMDYFVYIIAEHVNTTNETDYASAPCEITDIINSIDNTAITVTAPKGEVALAVDAVFDTGSIATCNVVWKKNGDVVSGIADYNTDYTVEITLTPKAGYVFTETSFVTINGNNTTTLLNNNGTLTCSYDFGTSAKRKITSIEAPITPMDDVFTNYYSESTILNFAELGETALVHFEGDFAPTQVEMDVVWSVIGSYDITPGVDNTFKWTVVGSEYASFDRNSISMEGTVVIKNKSSALIAVDIEAPEALAQFDTEADINTEIIDTADVIWMKNDTEVTGKADYNSKYTVKVIFAPKDCYVFTNSTVVTINGKTVSVVLNSDGTITCTYEFDKTAKRVITSLEVPQTPEEDVFTNYYTAENVLDSTEFGNTVKAILEGLVEPTEVDMQVSWSLVGDYDSTPGIVNTFKWVILNDEYDNSNVLMEGTVRIKNKEAMPIPITITEKVETIPETVEEIDLADSFNIPEDVGEVIYEIESTTGEGEIIGSVLKIIKPGDFVIKVVTTDCGNYRGGTATVNLTVNKAVSDGSAIVDPSLGYNPYIGIIITSILLLGAVITFNYKKTSLK